LSARWTDQDYADYQARKGLKIEIVSVEPKATNVQITREVKHDYKAEFEQQLSLVGIQVEREFYFARPRKWRSDWRVTGSKLLVEYEGGLFMESGGAHKAVGNILRDIEKYNAAAIAGWTVIRITPKFIPNGQALKWVEDALRAAETK
jgi:hypothetical protein